MTDGITILIARPMVEHYRHMLAGERDVAKRQIISDLLVEEEAKLPAALDKDVCERRFGATAGLGRTPRRRPPRW